MTRAVRQGPHRLRPPDRLVPGRQAPARRHQPGARDEQGDRRWPRPARSAPTTTYGPEAASMAKAFVGDAGVDLVQTCFQVFGGIGYTWEHDQHLYLRRITTDAGLFGDAGMAPRAPVPARPGSERGRRHDRRPRRSTSTSSGRRPARWIRANLEPRPPTAEPRGAGGDRTREEIAAARALQRRLFDAGYAGITFPAEYGGRGLTAAHERAFREEAAGYVTPDLGVAGGVTFGPIGRSLLAHASPEFLERHIPKILSGEEIWCQFYSEPEAGSDLAGIRTRADARRRPLDPQRRRRSGARARTTPTGRCASPAPTGTCRSTAASRGSPCRPTPRASRSSQITQINGSAEFCEEFLDDVGRHRRRRHRRGQPRLGRHPDDARLRARGAGQ